jgi:hypothetical protein
MTPPARVAALLAIVVALTCAACRPTDPLKLETIQLGRSVNPDGSVGLHTTTFKRTDTIYVSVLTTAAGAGTIKVKWMYAGRLVGEPEKKVSYREPRATEFHLANSGGFPPGDYSVEAFIDGVSVGKRPFNVAK